MKKGKPPLAVPKKVKDEDDSGDEEEEAKDTFDPVTKMPDFKGPIKPIQRFEDSSGITIPKPKKTVVDYSPSKWDDYYDKMEYLENGTSVYIAGGELGPVFVCLHGAGHSAQSFACVASEIKKFATCVAFDFRGHGSNKMETDLTDLSAETLIKDTLEVLKYVDKTFPNLTIVIMGHSMGGSIACKATEEALKGELAPKIQGLIVIDVVEGTAIEALPFMEGIVKSMPKSFPSLEAAIQWAVRSNTIKNLASAKVSIPPQLVESTNPKTGAKEYVWKVDLMASEKHWMGWFKGLTKSFLSIQVPKVLLLAGAERMDNELTIAHMQGKFRLKVIYDVGHSVQEDNWKETGKICYEFLHNFRIPLNLEEIEILKTKGIGFFHPNLPKNPYN